MKQFKNNSRLARYIAPNIREALKKKVSFIPAILDIIYKKLPRRASCIYIQPLFSSNAEHDNDHFPVLQ
jgi:hypothetical protein